MSSADWIDARLEQRRWAARRKLAARGRTQLRHRRRWWRDMARAALAVSLIVLAILVVEIGRKAVTVSVHASAVADLPLRG